MDVDSDSETQTIQSQQAPPFLVIKMGPPPKILGFSPQVVREMIDPNFAGDADRPEFFETFAEYVQRIKYIVEHQETSTIPSTFDRSEYKRVAANEHVAQPQDDESKQLAAVAEHVGSSTVHAQQSMKMGNGNAVSLEEVLRHRFLDILADSTARAILLSRFRFGQTELATHVAVAFDEHLESILNSSTTNAEVAHGTFKLLSVQPTPFEPEHVSAFVNKSTSWLHSRSQSEERSAHEILSLGSVVKVFTALLRLHHHERKNPCRGEEYSKHTAGCHMYYNHIAKEIPTSISLCGDSFWRDFMEQLFIIDPEPSRKHLSIDSIRLATDTGELGQVVLAFTLLGNDLREARQEGDEEKWNKLHTIGSESIINVAFLAGHMIGCRKIQLVYEAAKNVSLILEGRWNNLFGAAMICTWLEDTTLFEKVFYLRLPQFVVQDIFSTSVATKLKVAWLKMTLVNSGMDRVQCLVAKQWVASSWVLTQNLRLVEEVGLSEEKKEEWRAGGVFLRD